MLNGLTLGFYDLDKGETAFKKKDIGSTLAKYNVPEGPFLMIPLIGPKISREFTGTILNTNIMSNISSAPLNDLILLEVPLNAIDTRSKLSKTIDNIYESPDPYIKLRSFYIQNRRNNVYGKKYINLKNKETDAEFEKLLE
jgi:phospholipid-binding lipoprotein MlaA